MSEHGPRPGITETAKVQGERWSLGARDWVEVLEPVFVPLYTAALDAAELVAGQSVLDAGCGTGGAALVMRAKGASIKGCDVAPAMIAIASERVPEASFDIADLQALPYEDESFDLVVGFNSFQYTNDPNLAMTEARRTCRATGKVVLATWGSLEQCQAATYMAAIAALMPTPSKRPPEQFALSAEGAIDSLMREAQLIPTAAADVPCPFVFPDIDLLLRGVLSSAAYARPIELLGRGKIAQTITDAVARYRRPDGSYVLENVFKYVVAVKGDSSPL